MIHDQGMGLCRVGAVWWACGEIVGRVEGLLIRLSADTRTTACAEEQQRKSASRELGIVMNLALAG